MPQLPVTKHPTTLHAAAATGAAPTNFAAGAHVYVVDVDDYERYRSMLYALGAASVTNKMMANVGVIVHGAAAPAKARTKYPGGKFVRASAVLSLFHREVPGFGAFVRALQAHGFTVRNPSDEGDPRLDLFELPLVDRSLHATLLHYLGTSAFVRAAATRQHFPIDQRDDDYVPFEVPGAGVTWYYTWNTGAWGRVSAQRGDGDYPLEIKGGQLLRVEPLFWTASTGLFFHEYPHIDSINGLIVQAGIDARTGQVHGAAISRVWT